MNGDLKSTQDLSRGVRRQLGSLHGAQVVVFPPTPLLAPVLSILRDSAVQVGAQDVHPKKTGAFTSGCSAAMVRSLGCRWALVGHSERRQWFGDSDAAVAEKLRALLGEGIHPLLCVGESLQERKRARTQEVIQRQLETALSGHGAGALSGLVVAYEPVWAIGTGITATPEQANEVHRKIRASVASHLGPRFATALRIQYGGSVKPSNARELLAADDIDGALVGGASLDARSFTAIVYAGQRRGDGAATRRSHP